MAGYDCINNRHYARSSYYKTNEKEQRKRIAFVVPLHKKNEHINKTEAIQRKKCYETVFESTAIQMHKDGIKIPSYDLNWKSKSLGINQLKYEKRDEVKIEQAVKDWLNHLRGMRKKSTTITIYKRHLFEFMDTVTGRQLPIVDLSTKHVEQFTNNQRGTISTLHSKLRSLNNCINYVMARPEVYGLKDKPLVEKPTLPKKKPIIISNQLLNGIFEQIDNAYESEKADFLKEVYLLYRDTGLRLGEPFNNELKEDRLVIEAGTTKNSYERNVYLTVEQVKIIRQMRLIVDKKVKSGSKKENVIKYSSRIFKNSLKKTDNNKVFKEHMHNLRDTFATRLYYLTDDIYKVCGACGHADIGMTQKYTAFDEKELAKAFPDIEQIKSNGVNKMVYKDIPRVLQSTPENSYFPSNYAGVV